MNEALIHPWNFLTFLIKLMEGPHPGNFALNLPGLSLVKVPRVLCSNKQKMKNIQIVGICNKK